MCPTGTSLNTTTTSSSSSQPLNLRSAFDVLDADHDGKISHMDLQEFYKGFHIDTTSKQDVIGCMITMADSNKDGYVQYDEFEKVIGPNTSNDNKSDGVMEEVFRVMDRDGDGRVGVEDLKSYLRVAGMDVSEEDVMAMVKLGGGDGKGVSYEGFLKVLEV